MNLNALPSTSTSLLLLSLLALGGCSAESVAATKPSNPGDADASRGRALYETQCALCHGSTGEADGPASHLLFPPARDFTRGRFKLVSTVNGVPSDQDLIATLRRGIPGSSMPSWDWMPEEDLRALAGYVREIAIEGIAQDLRLDGDRSEEECVADALARMTPGASVDSGRAAEPTASTLERGRRLFRASCSACHGEDGTGRHDTLRRDEDDTMNVARDFTRGILKGGASHDELARRIQVGLHGTAMPSSQLDRGELADLVAYVRSLIPEGAEDRLVQTRETIRSVRVERGLLENADDFDWSAATEVDVTLAPLWWREGAVLHARVAAVHDGSTMGIRVRWEDPTPDTPTDLEWPLEAPPYADALGVQLSSELDPPFFGMGEGASPTNLWHWQAIDVPGTASLSSAFRFLPHRVGEWFTEEALGGMPLYQLARGPLHAAGETVSTTPAGMDILDRQAPLPASVAAVPTWESGSWEVLLTRPMEARSSRELRLRPGSRMAVNFAIWNGAARDLRGQKSITIWHTLEIEE